MVYWDNTHTSTSSSSLHPHPHRPSKMKGWMMSWMRFGGVDLMVERIDLKCSFFDPFWYEAAKNSYSVSAGDLKNFVSVSALFVFVCCS